MIDHSKCDHPSTSGARAKCRRGGAPAPKRTKGEATPKTIGPDEVDNYGQTPAWKADECHVCGVEKSEFQGTDAFTNLFVLVGEKCAWRVKRSEDFAAMRARR